jgi:hypothetical protein
LKKITAILFICIFAFSQYARQFNYLGCVMLNTFKAAAYKCDCEKRIAVSKLNTRQTTTPISHLHIHLDEYFDAPAFDINNRLCFKLLQLIGVSYAVKLCTGTLPKHWQPPSLTA